MDAYEFLGVSRGISEKELKKVYLKMLTSYHPDLHPNDEYANEMTKNIILAYKSILKGENFSFNGIEISNSKEDSELSQHKNEYNSKISTFKYVDINKYYKSIRACESVEEIWKIYAEAERENIQNLLRQVRVKILSLSLMDKEEKKVFISRVVDTVRNSNGNYDGNFVTNIEGILFEAIRRNAVLGVEQLRFLDSGDKAKYTEIINKADSENISNILSEAYFESYKNGVIKGINDCDYLSNRDKMDYLSSVDMVFAPEQLKDIFDRAKAHNEANRDNRLTAKVGRFLSSVFEPKEAEASKGRRK